ncbi:Protein of unknown function [Pyronema omphalodes CBS 100304]|uniref:Uncharacterized protein n=1 Tax=Pyronema omphalodes (strain CBS 100304) TaxID=1076935 RepID=U4LQK2_PYROM|nr:Protein of unknown function [Pyronema omphalodes CBS 100304]
MIPHLHFTTIPTTVQTLLQIITNASTENLKPRNYFEDFLSTTIRDVRHISPQSKIASYRKTQTGINNYLSSEIIYTTSLLSAE